MLVTRERMKELPKYVMRCPGARREESKETEDRSWERKRGGVGLWDLE